MRSRRYRNGRHRLEAPEGLEQRLVLTGPDLSIGDLANLSNYTVGQTINYTITVQNASIADPVSVGTPITVTDLAALGLSDVAVSATSGWSFTTTSSTSPSLITGTYTGSYPVAAGQTLPTITVTGVANGAALGVLANVATVSVAGDLNLANNTASIDVGIAAPATMLSVATASGTYGGTAGLSATLTSASVPVSGESVDFHIGSTDLGTATTNSSGVATIPAASLAAINAGTYSGDVTASFAGDSSFSASDGSASLVVSPASLTITADDQSKVYGAALPTLTASYAGFVNGDTSSSLTTAPTLTTTATSASHVAGSPYSITASGAVDPNYTISYVAGSLNVTAAPLTITANDQAKMYGAALPTLTASYAGFVNGDTSASLGTAPTITTTASAASHVAGSPYAITAGGAVDTDYTISYVAGDLNVTAAPLTITANDQTKLYGAALPTLTASYTGLVNGDTSSSLTTAPTITTTATAASHVAGNPYAITAGGAVDTDYTISYVAGSLTVTAAPLTITADDQAKVYGATLPTLTASYSGFVNGDTPESLETSPTLSTTATAASHVADGPYAITASGADDPDYSISYVPGALTVTPAPLELTVQDATKVYGQTVPTLIGFYSGFVNGDTPDGLASQATFSTTGTAASHVGTYPIVASGAVSSDYTVDSIPGTLTVTPATLTVTPNDVVKAYGVAVPSLTASYSGFVNGDTAASLASQPILSTTATAASDFGSYAITASGGASADYNLVYNAGSLTVPTNPDQVAFLDSLYQVILGRAPETDGLDAWQAALNNGASRSSVIGDIYGSPEAIAYRVSNGIATDPQAPARIALIEALYEDVLGRAPEASGLAGWIARLEAGMDAEQLAADIYDAPEAVADRSSLTPPAPTIAVETDLVVALYEDVLDRQPEDSGLQGWLTRLEGGMDAAQLAADIYESPEAVALRGA